MKWRPALAAFSNGGWVNQVAAVFLVVLAAVVYPARAQETHTGDALRQKAIDLFQQNKYEEALPLLEDLTVSRPNDAVLQEELGACLVAHAVNMPDPEMRRQTRLQARKAFLRAKALGDNSNFLVVELSEIPEDGSDVAYSSRAEVDSAMREAEAAFSRGDFDGAIAGYEQVLKLDPNNYEAMLFTGDVYFKQKDYDNSGKWFEKAISVDPNRETAYRYWGDALYSAGKNDDAREKYVLAIVAEPYVKASWIGLIQWAQRNHVSLSQPKIQTPKSPQGNADGGATVTLDINILGKKDGSEAWIVYAGTRTIWKNKRFLERFPNEKEYRHSLPEEAEALGSVADVASEDLQSKKIKPADLNPELATLIKLQKDGLLESYILLSRADQGITQDYAAYRTDHRDKLIQYMHEYILPQTK